MKGRRMNIEDIEKEIRHQLIDKDKSLTWLAKKMGMARQTLSVHLNTKRHKTVLEQALNIIKRS